ncbi:MAG: hypothetical protein WDO13_17540 [Verrucomicrobiota bacterium]
MKIASRTRPTAPKMRPTSRGNSASERRLVHAHVFQRQRTQRQREGDHPVAIAELRFQRVVAQPVDVVEDVIPHRMPNPQRQADDPRINELQELLVEVVLPGQHIKL